VTIRPTKTGSVGVDKALGDIRAALKAPAQSHVYLFGANSLSTLSVPVYLYPGFQTATASSSTEACQVALHDGRLENLRVHVLVAGDTAGTVTFGVRVNGQDTQLLATCSQTAAGVFAARPGTSVAVKTGDKLSIVVRKTTAPATAQTVVTANFELVF
jgi:hypothetical protein